MTITIGNEQIISLTRRGGRSKGVAPISEPSAQPGFVGMRTITAGSRSRVLAGREAGHVALKVEEIDAQLRRTYTPLSARALIVPPLSMPTATAPCTISPSAVAPDRKGCGRAHGWTNNSDGPDRVRRGSCDGQTPRGCWGMLKTGWCRDIARTDAAGPSCRQAFVSECV